MRLDHLLSKEKLLIRKSKYNIQVGRGEGKLGVILFNFEGLIVRLSEGLKWHWKGPWLYGGVAQMGEHLPCTQGVRSSSLLISTNSPKGLYQGNEGSAEDEGQWPMITEEWAHSSGG